MELLRRAVREDLQVWMEVADASGATSVHELRPISLAAGLVRGYERGQDGLAAYPVHRITALQVLDDER
jgi:predicted DNA-binding transcriptional regulator YafY